MIAALSLALTLVLLAGDAATGSEDVAQPSAYLRVDASTETVTLIREPQAAMPAGDELSARDLVLPWREGAWFEPLRPAELAGIDSLPFQPGAVVRLTVEEGELTDDLPAAFALRLRRTGEPAAAPLGPRFETFLERLRASDGGLTLAPCLKRENGWRCNAPRGVYDAVLHVGQRMETLWRGLDLTQPVELRLPARAGSTLTASVTPGSARILLFPRLLGDDRGRVDMLRARSVAVAHDGSLRIDGLRRGAYRLAVEADGFARRIVDLQVSGDTVLEPLSLSPPADVAIAIDPPRAFDGEPWSARWAPKGAGDEAEVVALDQRGWATLSGLAVGDYRLSVHDGGGSQWLFQEVAVEPGEAVLSLHVPHLDVVGTARSGDRPLQGALIFGTSYETVSVRLALEDDGSFAGFLPREGAWSVEWIEAAEGCRRCGAENAVQLPPVDVEVGPSGKAMLAIRLPDTVVRGEVVRRDGERSEPAAGARINAIRYDAAAGRMPNDFRALTADDGSFEVRGVSPGEILVNAISADGDASSPFVAVQVADGGPEAAPLRLTLRTLGAVSLALSSPHGAVAGARVAALPVLEPGAESTTWVEGASGADGVAALEVPEGTRHLDLIVTHPGYAAWLGRIAVDAGSPRGLALVERLEGAALDVAWPEQEPRALWDAGYLVAGGAQLPNRVLFHMIGDQLRIDPDRTLHLDALTPGEYVYCWTLAGVVCRPVRLDPGGRARVEMGDGNEIASASAVIE